MSYPKDRKSDFLGGALTAVLLFLLWQETKRQFDLAENTLVFLVVGGPLLGCGLLVVGFGSPMATSLARPATPAKELSRELGQDEEEDAIRSEIAKLAIHPQKLTSPKPIPSRSIRPRRKFVRTLG
jgi:hypothetical protein